MTRNAMYTGLALVSAMLVGCGGGHSIPPDPPPPVTTLEDVVRTMQPGDEWRYSVSGTVTDSVKGSNISVVGTDKVTTTGEYVPFPSYAGYPYKGEANVMLHAGEISGPGYNVLLTDRLFVLQDLRGIWGYGWYDWQQPDNPDGWHWSKERWLIAASPMNIGTSWKATIIEYVSQKLVLDEYCVVTSTETITVPAGNYETYRVTGNGRFAGLWATELDIWWAPGIGAPVKVNLTAEDGMNNILRLKFQLEFRTRT